MKYTYWIPLAGTVRLPDATDGDWRIERRELTEEEVEVTKLHAQLPGGHIFAVEPGSYTMLHCDGHIVMSDTQMEERTNQAVVLHAAGDVLIFGLGIGMILPSLLANKRVKSVTVVELQPEVIHMVAPHYSHPKLRIEMGDAFLWYPDKYGTRYDYIYYDIWNSLCADHVEEMKRLTRRSLKYRKAGGVTECWARTYMEIYRKRTEW